MKIKTIGLVLAVTIMGVFAATSVMAQKSSNATKAVSTTASNIVYQDEVDPAPVSSEPAVISSDCASCDSCGTCDSCAALCCPSPAPLRLLSGIEVFERYGVNIHGWLAAGGTLSNHNSVDNYNGPMTYGDRENELQLNQLQLVIEKEADGSAGLGLGGRIDFMYGTDHRFNMARGLEYKRNGDNQWNGGRFYGIALPQAYVDVAYEALNVRLGHFYTNIGHEAASAPKNFFYSRSYTIQYGEPFTHTGILASYELGDTLSVSGGLHRGWDNWEDHPNNDQLDFLGGITWTSADERSSLAFAITSGDEDDANGGFSPRTMYSVVFTQQVNDRISYVLQHDNGVQDSGYNGRGRVEDAQWYGINQYFLYQIDCVWSAGMRVEWFRDDDGTRVAGVGDGNLAQGPYEGSFWGFTWGLNYKPNDNLVIRPEFRYDWFDGPVGQQPYDAGNADDQFTAAVDVVILW